MDQRPNRRDSLVGKTFPNGNSEKLFRSRERFALDLEHFIDFRDVDTVSSAQSAHQVCLD
jgi:hypothetical protein